MADKNRGNVVRGPKEATTSLDQRLLPHDVAGVDAIRDAAAFNTCLLGAFGVKSQSNLITRGEEQFGHSINQYA